MTTLAELKQHPNPLWRITAGAWEGCGVVDDDLPDPLPDLPTVSANPLTDSTPEDDPTTWLERNCPKVFVKVAAAAKTILGEGNTNA